MGDFLLKIERAVRAGCLKAATSFRRAGNSACFLSRPKPKSSYMRYELEKNVLEVLCFHFPLAAHAFLSFSLAVLFYALPTGGAAVS